MLPDRADFVKNTPPGTGRNNSAHLAFPATLPDPAGCLFERVNPCPWYWIVNTNDTIQMELGGEKGVTTYTLPTGQTFVLPNDRAEALKNLVKATVNPVEQTELAVKVGQSVTQDAGGIWVSTIRG